MFALMFSALFFIVSAPDVAADTAVTSSDTDAFPPVVGKALDDVTLPFVDNEGQIGSDEVKYYVNTFAGGVFVTDSGLRYSVRRLKQTDGPNDPEGGFSSRSVNRDKASSDMVEGVVFDERFVDRSGEPIIYVPQGRDKTDIPVTYFQGSDPSKWKKDVRNYDSLFLGELWQGIDVDLKARGRNIEKIFTVRPGANPDEISIGLTGVDEISIKDDGVLNIATSLGDISMTAPVAYQQSEDGTRVLVDISYEIHGDKRYGFSVGEYDRTRPLVVDPLLAGTFLGTGSEDIFSMAVDTNGDVFVAGTTAETDFPVTTGVYQQAYGGGSEDFFISKFDADLTRLLASTFLGGSGDSYYNVQIKLDPSHNVYMAASYTASDYPTTVGAYQETCTVGAYERCAVVSRLSNDLTSLLASTYVGNNDSFGKGVAIDQNGKVYLVGTTEDPMFPTTTGAYKRTDDANPGDEEVFVSRLNANLTALEASTFVGPANAFSIKIDTDGEIFIAGADASYLYPATPGAYDTSNPNRFPEYSDIGDKYFISKLSSDLDQLIASTFFGGTSMYMYVEGPEMMQLDSSGNVYLSLDTGATDIPTTSGAYQETNQGEADLFISKFSNDLASLLASTYLGGSDYEEHYGGFGIDADDNVFVTAFTPSQDYPTTPGSFQPMFPAENWGGVVVSKLTSDLTMLSASTWIMFNNIDIMFPYALAFDASGDVYVGGSISASSSLDIMVSEEFPTTPDAYQTLVTQELYASNGAIAKFDNDLSGTLVIRTPAIATSAATNLTSTSATLKATVTDDGGETPTVTLKWGTQSGSYPNTCAPVANSGSAFSCDLTGLTPSTAYYVLASAENSAGTGTGSEVSFQTTASEGAPSENPIDEDDEEDGGITDDECVPKKLSGKVLQNGTVRLSWSDPCDSIDKIVIERKTEQGTFGKIATVKEGGRSFEDDVSGLPSGTYTYRIRGYREASGKYSDYSGKKSVAVTRPKVVVAASRPVTTEEETSPDRAEPAASEAVPVPETVATSPVVPSEALPAGGNGLRKIAAGIGTLMFPGMVAGADASLPASFPFLSASFAVLAFAGLFAGAAIALSSTAVPLFTTSPAPLGEAVSRALGMLGFVGKKRGEAGWGIVFDGETRRPVAGVAVSIINADGRVADVSVSDSQGRYGFLPGPGAYTLGVSKKGYELRTADSQDILYGDLYTGQVIRVDGSEMRTIHIALRATDVDWQDFARRKVASYVSAFSVVKRDTFLILFYTGLVINAGIAYLFPTRLNLILLAAYLCMFVYYVFFKKKRYGVVTNAKTGHPVPFTMLSVHDAVDPKRRVAFAVSDVLGRYFMFVQNGEYILKVSGTFLGGVRFEKTVPVSIADGVVRSDVEV